MKTLKMLFALLFVTLSVLIPFAYSPSPAAVEGKRFTVVIDAGHGGIDGGAVSSDGKVFESEINLKIANKIKERFIAGGFGVIMTRTDENGLYGLMSKGFKRRDMEERVRRANSSNADILISVHLNNYADRSRRGAQVFFRAGDAEGKRLADCIQNSLNESVNTDRKYSALAGDYYILNETKMPSAICECGFLSNEEDLALLVTDEHAALIAKTLFSGVVNFFARA